MEKLETSIFTQDRKKNKRHCMVVHAYYPLGEPRVQRQAKALHKAGFEVDVICLRRTDEPARDIVEGIQIYRLPVQRYPKYGILVQFFEYLLFFFLASWTLLGLHLKKQYPVIQIHNLPDFLVFSALIPKLMGARVILDLHDLMPEFYAARFKTDINALPVRLVQFQEKLSCWFADYIITVTEPWRQALIERGVPAHKCGVVMNLPDPHIFNDATHPNDKFETQNTIRVFYHGNVTYRYGLDILVKAFAQVSEKFPDVRLTIHGRGDYQHEIQALIETLKLDQTVTFNSQILPLKEVVPLIKSATLAVVPYRQDVFTDGILPTKLAEYAALGIPTITSKTSAIQTYFQEDMVYFTQPGDIAGVSAAIIDLIDNQQKLKKLSTSIRKFNDAHSWQKEAKHYTALIEKISPQSSIYKRLA